MSEILPKYVSLLINLVVTCSYVGFLYLIPSHIRALPRNDIVHVRWRMGVIIVTTVLMTVAVGFMFNTLNYQLSGDDFLKSAGFGHRSLFMILVTTVALMIIFYIGKIA